MFVARTGRTLLGRSSPTSSTRSSFAHFKSRAMSSIYVLPFDPTSAAQHSTPVANVSAADLWSSTPSAAASKPASVGTTHVFYATPDADKTNLTVVTSLGGGFAKKTGDVKRELIRKAIGSAVKQARAQGEGVKGRTIYVDASADPHAAAVGANLALYKFSLKTSSDAAASYVSAPSTTPQSQLSVKPITPSKEWDEGAVYAYAQNLARTLMELPANMMTPTAFAKRVEEEFAEVGIKPIVRDEAWAAEKGMRTFLSVAKGTSEPAKFLEIHYNGASEDVKPLVLVGKGITFDSGGISLKSADGMKLMRGDMGGAATVCAAALAIAKLKLPVNLIVLTPLTENMPGSANKPGASANKPGDIVYAMNGKTVEVDNTDAEGRLVLADALWYGSSTFKPHTIIDVATLTGAMDYALGEIYTGVFSTSDSLWSELEAAGQAEHDRLWRMPLDEEYGPQIQESNADLCNTGGKPAGACTAALFLKSFVEGIEPADDAPPPVRWAHLDIAGTMEATRIAPYQELGMTGRGTRALIEFVRRTSA